MPYMYSNVSTSVVIKAAPAIFGGLSIIPKTTGVVTVTIYDATATGVGTAVAAYIAASAAGQITYAVNPGVICRTGIFASISCTSGADAVVVYYTNPK